MNGAAYGCAQPHFRNCRMFDEATEEFPAGGRAHLHARVTTPASGRAAGTSCARVAHDVADSRPHRLRTARRQPTFLRRAVERRAPDRARTLQHLAPGRVPPRAHAAPAGGGAGIAPAPADRGYAVHRHQRAGSRETGRARQLRGARLHHSSPLPQCGFRPDPPLPRYRARRPRRARPRGARARGGARGGAHHVGTAAPGAVDGVRRFRRPPPPLRAGKTGGQARATRIRGGAQRSLRDATEIPAPGRPRNVAPAPPARAGDVVVQPRDHAARRALSKTAGAHTGPDRHRRGRGNPARVPPKQLERDIVVHVVELARGFLRGLVLARGDGLSRLAAARFSRTLPASEHLHALGDDFGGGALLAFLVLPLARAQGPFDVDLRAFLQVFAGDLGEAAEEHHAVPLGAFLFFSARLVFPGVGGGDRNVRDRSAFGVVTRLGIAPEIAYQNHFVYRSH